MVRVLFLFLLVFMGILPVAKAIQHARISKLRRHVAICRRGNILKTFFYENGGVFSYNKNPDLPQNYKKTMLSWKSSEAAREKRRAHYT